MTIKPSIVKTCISKEGLKRIVTDGVAEMYKTEKDITKVKVSDIEVIVQDGEIIEWQAKMEFVF